MSQKDQVFWKILASISKMLGSLYTLARSLLSSSSALGLPQDLVGLLRTGLFYHCPCSSSAVFLTVLLVTVYFPACAGQPSWYARTLPRPLPVFDGHSALRP